MELLDLYFTFLKLGLFNFGGGYALLPLIQREVVNKKGWATDEEVIDYFAVGQCTPGVISINVSTFIGYKRKGVLGAIVAGLGFVTPAFIIIFLIATLLTNFADNEYVKHALGGIRIMVFFLVLAAIVKLCKKSFVDIFTAILGITVGILAIFVSQIPLFCYIIFAAIFGIVLNTIKERHRVKDQENNEEAEEDKEENLELSSEVAEKPSKKKNAISFILGFIFGAAIGLFAILSFPFVKNKKYRNGVLSTAFLNLIMIVCALFLIFKHNAILFKLYFQFFKVGLLAFGGGLATIPFLQELGTTTGWFTQEALADMIAVSESTPGAMGINMSTYVGYITLQNQYGNYFYSFVGSIISTLGIISPAIIVIIIISIVLKKFKDNKYVGYAFYGLRAASVGLIIAAAYSILEISILKCDLNGSFMSIIKDSFRGVNAKSFFSHLGYFFDNLINWKNLGVGMIFGVLVFKIKKHPIIYIMLAAIVGIVLQI